MKNYIICLLVLLLTVNVFALGVTPARKVFAYSPDLNSAGSFKILNTEGIERELVIQTRGELGDSIMLDERRVKFSSGQSEAEVTYRVNINSPLNPGSHIGEIVISEPQQNVEDDDTVVGATLSVVTQVSIFVPYPGKYAEAKLNINSASKGEDVLFKFTVVNRGEFDLTNVYANIDVYTELNENISSFNTKSVSIATGQQVDITENWVANVPVGNYKAVVTLVYDGESSSLEDTFQVGTESLEVQQITVSNFKLGDIAKMELLVENQWSSDIDQVYTQMQIFSSGGDILADFKSPDTNIGALSKKVLTSYWDTAGVKEGTYDTKVIIHYAGGKSVDTDIQLVVKSDSLEVIGLGYVLSSTGGSGFNISENLVMILIIVIGILILVNLLWFFILRRVLQKK